MYWFAGSKGHNVIVKVLDQKVVRELVRAVDNSKSTIAESLVGDNTGAIILSLRNEQIQQVKPGQTITIRNAKVDMYKGHMRLAVDKWGLIEVTGSIQGDVNTNNNLSDTEYELVNAD